MTEKENNLTELTECTGCGAKVSASELSEILGRFSKSHNNSLLVGFDSSDDAAVYQLNEDLCIVQTIDFFPPIVDDPYCYGAISAANAISDIYAMGGEPKLALNILMIPYDMPKKQITEILRGGYDKISEAGAVIAGGHSIYDKTPKYGMTVTGTVDCKRIFTNKGSAPGDVLVYTKRIGIGVLTTAVKGKMIHDHLLQQQLNDLMMTLNKYVRDIMIHYPVHACTDITGYGMLGHLLEMAQGSNTEIHLNCAAIETLLLPESENLAKMGILSSGVYQNRHFAQSFVNAGRTRQSLQDLLYDPQTSGGLMISLPSSAANDLVRSLKADPHVPAAAIIGEVKNYAGRSRIYL